MRNIEETMDINRHIVSVLLAVIFSCFIKIIEEMKIKHVDTFSRIHSPLYY